MESEHVDHSTQNDDVLREATKRAFLVLIEQARTLAEVTDHEASDQSRQELYNAYIDYMAFRTAARGRWGRRGHGRHSRFRRFFAVRLAVSIILFLPLWIAAVFIIADHL